MHSICIASATDNTMIIATIEQVILAHAHTPLILFLTRQQIRINLLLLLHIIAIELPLCATLVPVLTSFQGRIDLFHTDGCGAVGQYVILIGND